MKNISIILLALICVVPVMAQSKVNNGLRKLPWSIKKKLSWSDFKPVDICTTAMPDGVAEWGMVATYTSTSQNEHGKMHVITVLKLDDCWICNNVVKNDTLLWYLQVSYNLAELCNRKLNKMYGDTSVKGMQNEEIGQLMMKNQGEIERLYMEKRTLFFEESRHGLYKDVILRWKEETEKELKENKK